MGADGGRASDGQLGLADGDGGGLGNAVAAVGEVVVGLEGVWQAEGDAHGVGAGVFARCLERRAYLKVVLLATDGDVGHGGDGDVAGAVVGAIGEGERARGCERSRTNLNI